MSPAEQCGLCTADADYLAEVEEVESGDVVFRGLCERHYTSFTAWWMAMCPVESPESQEAVQQALLEVSDFAE